MGVNDDKKNRIIPYGALFSYASPAIVGLFPNISGNCFWILAFKICKKATIMPHLVFHQIHYKYKITFSKTHL